MLRRLVSALILMLAPMPALSAPSPIFAGATMGGYQATASDGTIAYIPAVTFSDISGAPLGTSGNPLYVSSASGSGASANQVQGPGAAGAASTGNPFPASCVYKLAPTGVATGQAQNILCNPNGAIMLAGDLTGSATFDSVPYAVFLQDRGKSGVGASLYPLGVLNGYYNPYTGLEVTARGDTTGIDIGGHGSLATAQVSVGTSATLIAAARTGRQKLIVSKQAAANCAYGGSTVTLTTGFIPDNSAAPTAGMSFNWDTAAALYGVCASATTHTEVEEY